MGLEEYRSKRNFDRTAEPKEGVASEERIFVVQEHYASRLHYDLRLSMDGALKSWAMPKGIPMEAGTKKLAVQTEDHPLEYADFEGVIPKGEYGAGEVLIWDKGAYDLEQIDQDKLVFRLRGRRLNARYSLIRFRRDEGKGRDWLLVRL